MTYFAVLAFINGEIQVEMPVPIQYSIFLITRDGKIGILSSVVNSEDAFLGLIKKLMKNVIIDLQSKHSRSEGEKYKPPMLSGL